MLCGVPLAARGRSSWEKDGRPGRNQRTQEKGRDKASLSCLSVSPSPVYFWLFLPCIPMLAFCLLSLAALATLSSNSVLGEISSPNNSSGKRQLLHPLLCPLQEVAGRQAPGQPAPGFDFNPITAFCQPLHTAKQLGPIYHRGEG